MDIWTRVLAGHVIRSTILDIFYRWPGGNALLWGHVTFTCDSELKKDQNIQIKRTYLTPSKKERQQILHLGTSLKFQDTMCDEIFQKHFES
jgi:hypothetical protein